MSDNLTRQQAKEQVCEFLRTHKPGRLRPPRLVKLQQEIGYSVELGVPDLERVLLCDGFCGGVFVSVQKPFFSLQEEKLPWLVEQAKQDPYAASLLKDIVIDYLRNRKTIPKVIRRQAAAWTGERSIGKKIANGKNAAKGYQIAVAVGYVSCVASLYPVRNRASDPVSACDVVVEACRDIRSRVTYEKVEKAWEKYGKSTPYHELTYPKRRTRNR